MQVHYDTKRDLLYLRMDEDPQEVTNQRVADGIVLDLGEKGKLVGIEILDASTHLNLAKILPVTYAAAPGPPLAVRERS